MYVGLGSELGISRVQALLRDRLFVRELALFSGIIARKGISFVDHNKLSLSFVDLSRTPKIMSKAAACRCSVSA